MEKTKLFAQFKSLNSSEVTALGKFLISPIYNKDTDVNALFNFLKSNKKKKKPNYNRHFFEKQYKTKKKFNKIASDLSILIEHFWVTNSILDDEFSKRLSILKQYRKRNLEECFIRSFNEFIKFLNNQSLRNDSYWNTLYLVLLEHLEYITSLKSRGNAESWKKVLESFEISYLSGVIKMLCVSLTQESVSKEKFETDIYKFLLEYIGKKPALLENPAIAVYYYFYKAEQEPGIGFFNEMVNCIHSFDDQFAFEEKRDIYMLAISHCIKRYNKGENQFLEKYVELNLKGLDRGYLLKSGQISQFLYTNTIRCFCLLNRFKIAESFANKYKELLDPKIREDVYVFCIGKILFYKGDYTNAAITLSKFKSNDVLNDLDVRNMLLKIAINDDPFAETTESLLRNANTQLTRKKDQIPPNWLNHYDSIFKTMHTLLRYIKEPNSKEKTLIEKKLLKEIENIKSKLDREWFLKQLNKHKKGD